MAWGINEVGQLGIGTNNGPSLCWNKRPCSPAPVKVTGLSGIEAVSAGQSHALALRSNGTVMAWGDNYAGALGNGSETNSDVPVVVSGLTDVTAISAGAGHSLALLSNGTVMSWGAEFARDSTVPVQVSGLSGVTAISAGAEQDLALLEDGTVMAWGQNALGELGDGTTETRFVPVAVSGLSSVTAISAGQAGFSLALVSDGTVKAWGYNYYGQLGNGTTNTTGCTCSDVPVTVSELARVKHVSGGAYHSLALLSNGTVMSWGTNNSGELGNGTTMDSDLPVAVSDLSGVTAISAGSGFSLAYIPQPSTTVTKLTPDKGPAAGGTKVTITGQNFTGATAVNFGSLSATSFTVKSPTSIIAVTRAEVAKTVDVTVTTSNGTSAISSLDRFKFGPPTVTSVSPNAGSKAGGTSVTVTGTGFGLGTEATLFRFGAKESTTVNCTSNTTCRVVVPSHVVGTVNVKATVSGQSSPKVVADQYTYN